MKKLDLSKINDPVVRDNFKKLQDDFDQNPFLATTWTSFERTFDAAGTITVTHNLGYIPNAFFKPYDAASVTFSEFTATTIKLTATTDGTVRFLLGRMK